MKLWIASSNQRKISEFKQVLSSTDFEIHTQSELSSYSCPEENGDSFLANAKIKAKYLKALKSDEWVIADDSGIEVEGLKNLPGIHSARYAGPKSTDIENNEKILKMLRMRTPKNRNAQFCCVLVAMSPSGKEFSFCGKFKGSIAQSSCGQQGFGYDSIFIPEGEEKTLAELGVVFKNKISHRALALRAFAKAYTNGETSD